jgi:acetolactate synthase-1/2/3 large subunit
VPTTRTLGALLAERLYETGVRRAYGFPGGGSNLELIDAFDDAGIRWILTHTEGGAAFMACAEAELGNAPGVLVVGNGPGLASAVNGVAHAWLDRVPLVVISDRYTDEEAASTGHQVLDQRGMLQPIVKLGVTLAPDGAASAIDAAIAASFEPPRGPVHFDMRRDAAALEVPHDREVGDAARCPEEVAAHARHDEDPGLARLADELLRASRPVVLVGLEANLAVSPRDLAYIANAVGAAVLTTYKAKGAYPEDDPRWAGILTGAEIERAVLAQADVILAVGLDAVELLGRPWDYDARVLSIAATEQTDRHLRPVVRVVGDVSGVVTALAEYVRPRSGAGFTEAEVAHLRDDALDSLRLDADEPLPGWRIVETVTSVLPPDTIIAVDAGAHMFPATSFSRPSGPHRFLISNGLATMGFAVPSAVGAALANPDAIAVAFTGDGGMAYHADELETATRSGAKVIVVVFNDSSLSLIRIKQEMHGPAQQPLRFGLSRFDLLAQAFGVRGVVATTETELRQALAEAVVQAGSTVIDVRTSGREYGDTIRVIRG